MKLTHLIAAAPWREAVTFRETWPHEYVLLNKDGERELMQAVCRRVRDGDTGMRDDYPGPPYWLKENA